MHFALEGRIRRCGARPPRPPGAGPGAPVPGAPMSAMSLVGVRATCCATGSGVRASTSFVGTAGVPPWWIVALAATTRDRSRRAGGRDPVWPRASRFRRPRRAGVVGGVRHDAGKGGRPVPAAPRFGPQPACYAVVRRDEAPRVTSPRGPPPGQAGLADLHHGVHVRAPSGRATALLNDPRSGERRAVALEANR